MTVAMVATVFFSIHSGHSIALAPTSGEYSKLSQQLIALGRSNLREENYSEALEMFESALVANPANVEALIAIGDTYGAIAQRDRSLRYYRQALGIEPNNRSALEAQALALIEEGDREGAMSNLERLKRICGAAGCPEIGHVEQVLSASEDVAGTDSAGGGGGLE